MLFFWGFCGFFVLVDFIGLGIFIVLFMLGDFWVLGLF